MTRHPVAIVGAGPAGLCAGYELSKRGIRPILVEKGEIAGGLSRTESYRGYRFDVGGHRFYTKALAVEQIWHEVLGDDLLVRQRLSRIYYNGRFYPYPLNLTKTLLNLGPLESARIGFSYLKWQLRPYPQEETFEEWVTNRFGDRLYRTFFKTYTEKVWGLSCAAIRSDWAAQRIKGLSLKTAVANALFGTNGVKSLIEEFLYPRLGPGMMWERMQEKIEEQGGQTLLDTEVVSVKHDGRIVESMMIRQGDQTSVIEADQYITSMPLAQLAFRLDPPPPQAVLDAASSLNYRDFLIVVLIIDQENLFPDNWLYIHDPEVKVGRIQNFKNWSEEMVPNLAQTSLGLEYFCSVGDETWEMSDDALMQLAAREIDQLGLANADWVTDGTVIRQRKAYPVYDKNYRRHVQTIADCLDGFVNLQTIGRNGMHRYNNQDHSMLTGILAARNILGERHDLWEVNIERSYYEEVLVSSEKSILPSTTPIVRQSLECISRR